MSFLYSNYKGYPVHAHSYSGGSEYSDCPKKYDYSRRQGWKEREKRASSAFGTALEAAIQWYHTHYLRLEDAVDEWKHLWLLRREDKTLTYSEKDGDWESMYHQGEEMLRLYAAVLPSLPIQDVEFQVNYKKELFPDTEYAGLEFTSFVDMLSWAPYDHPLLPPETTDHSQNGKRKVVIDIKTSAVMYPTDPRLASMDPQLRSYAWASGIETVAFLVFLKRSQDVEKGDVVTLIEASHKDPHPVGAELVVLKTEGSTAVLLTQEVYDKYKEEAKGIKGNALKEIVEKYAEDGYHCKQYEFTKQRIQFLAAVISDKDRDETGEAIGAQARTISDANQLNFFPKKPGVRFPNNHCTFCSYLGLCIGDDKMVEEKLIQIGNVQQPVEKDWLEEL